MVTETNQKIILDTARATLEIECEALNALISSIGNDFVKVVDLIYTSKGRVVVTGVGKSALIAQKIVATFNSTGTPSIFMHAADAIHGDMGMIQLDDLVLCLSKSGDTAEVKVLVPLVQNMGNPVIGMTARKNSFLGAQADLLLFTPIQQEGDPNNLAPTASTTSQMALGDAMASALLALKGFTQEQFAKFHPGGSLGKQLYLKVHHLSEKNECPSVGPDASLRECILEMTSKRLGATAVTDPQKKLLGLITDGDLRRMLERNENMDHLTAKDIMTTSPKCIDPDTLAIEALSRLRESSINQLVVTRNGILKGFIHLHDLVREGLV